MAIRSTLSDAQLIEHLLKEYASIPHSHGQLQSQIILDHHHNRFLLLTFGWDGDLRIHSVVVDVELRDGKFWVHRDGTEDGIVADLEKAGVSRERIVLAWIPESERKHTEYAVK